LRVGASLILLTSLAAQTVATSTGSTTTTPTGAAALGVIEPITVEADRLYADPKQGAGVYIAEGNAVVFRGTIILKADRVTFYDQDKRVLAEGRVTVIEPTSILNCTRVEMRFPSMRGFLDDVELRIKSPIPESIRATMSARQLLHYGKDQLIVEAKQVERLGRREFDLEDGVFTACDCGEGSRPTWQINSLRAHVDLDSGALLWLPIFYAEGVPILPLPAFYFPLGVRRTGLLVPRIAGIGNTITGLRLGAPLFLALSESWDATIEPEYFQYRGLASDLELRWAPSTRAHGQIDATLVQDRGLLPPGATSYRIGLPTSEAIYRYGIAARHEQRFDRAKLVADINLLGDPVFNEFQDLFLVRQAETATSRITLTSTSAFGGGTRLATGLLFLEDLRIARYHPEDQSMSFDPNHPYKSDFRRVELLSADENGGGVTRQRFFEVRFDAFPHAVLGPFVPLLGEARLTLDSFAAPLPNVPRFARLDFRPQLTFPLHLDRFATFEASMAGRFTGWAGYCSSPCPTLMSTDAQGLSATRYAFIAKALLFTELGRRYDGFIHRVRPEIAYLIIPSVARLGDDAFRTNDEIDLLSAVQQVRATIRNDILEASTGRRIGGLDAWIGRDLGLSGTPHVGISELVLRGDLDLTPSWVPLRTTLFGNMGIAPPSWVSPLTYLPPDTPLHGALLTEVVAGVSFLFNAVHSFSVIYGNFNARMPTSTLLATEEIVPSNTISTAGYVPRTLYSIEQAMFPTQALTDPRAVKYLLELPWSSYRGVVLSALVKPIRQLTLSFSMTIAPEPTIPGLSPIRNTSSLIRWDSDCDCFGVGIVAVTDRTRPPGLFGLPDGFSANFIISLGRLGEIRSQR
jgi:hypothetical protein